MANRSKQKGDRIERKIVEIHRNNSIHCQRTLLPAQAGRQNPGDLLIGDSFHAEVKSRAHGEGFSTIERWKGENDILFLHRNNKTPLVVMEMDLYLDLMKNFH